MVVGMARPELLQFRENCFPSEAHYITFSRAGGLVGVEALRWEVGG